MNASHTPARAAAAVLLLSLVAAGAAAAAAARQLPTQQPVAPAADQPATLPAQTPDAPRAVIRHRTPRPPQPAVTNPTLILLDPGHGAADNGATFADKTFEKDINIAFAGRLRSSLAAQGFSVVMTHENAADDVPPDARVELANRVHPLACLLLHASNAGHGVHLYTSSLQQRLVLAPVAADPADAMNQPIQPWDTAQATALPQSARLMTDLNSALSGLRLPLVTGHASIRPIDSLNCPAVMVELAPLGAGKDASGAGYTSVSDASYQQRVADALTQALVLWRGHWQTPAMLQAQAITAARKPLPGQKTPSQPRSLTQPQTGLPRGMSLQNRTPAQKPAASVGPSPATAPRTPAPIVRPPAALNPQPATPRPISPVAVPPPNQSPAPHPARPSSTPTP